MAFPNYSGWAVVHPSTVTAVAPTANDDVKKGYEVGSGWINTATGLVYTCVDTTAGAAVWKQTSN